MKNTQTQQDDITVDGVFGYVMSKPENCLHLLRCIYPERHIKWVKPFEQKVANNGNKEKNTRFDVWIYDDQYRIYDLEMQKTFDDSFGLRVRYYQSELDRLALKEGEDYHDLKPLSIIFLFLEDYFGGNQIIYHGKMEITEEHDRELVSNLEFLFINAKGKKGHVSPDLKAFLAYLNGIITPGNKFIEKLDREVKEYIASPEWRQRRVNLAVKIADAKHEEKIEAIKKTINRAKKWGISNQDILDGLLQDYGKSFSEEDIKKLIQKN